MAWTQVQKRLTVMRQPPSHSSPLAQLSFLMATHNWIYARYDDSGSAYLGGMQHHEPSTSQPSSNVPPPRDIDSHEWVASANNAPTTTNILGTQMMTGYNQEHGLPTRSDYSVQNLHYSQCALMQRVDHAHAALDRCSSRSDEHPFTLSLDQFMHFPTDHRSINSNPSTSMTTSQPYIIPTNSSSFAPLSSIPIGPIRSAQQQPPNSHIARGNQTKAHRPYTGSEPPPHLQHYLDGIVLSTWWNDNECEPAGALDPFIKKNVENMWCCQMIGCEKTFQRKDRGIDHWGLVDEAKPSEALRIKTVY
ncbi:hypothetical protein FRC17_010415 [Serendipita sp. 399]|nr:hypothetical protein FRC17_010415 [Serendipita sp. 399]